MRKFLVALLFGVGTIAGVAHAANNCTGATYYDVESAACIPCPIGYNYDTNAGKVGIASCKLNCNAGKYLVSEYTLLEYLESNGTQYIDTDVIATVNTGVYVRASLTKMNTENIIFGATETYRFRNSKPFAIDVTSSNHAAMPHGANGTSISYNDVYTTIAKGSIYNYKINYFGNPQTSVNNVSVAMGASNTITSRTLYLFDWHTSDGSTTYRAPGVRIYSAHLTEAGSITHNYVPARRNSDNRLGLYDAVTGDFLTNGGTGEFIAGADVGAIGVCKNVGVGYWAAASTVNFGDDGVRNACPAGTTTVGYGHGADSANDCAHTLHIGDYVLYARRDKLTTPSLNIELPNEDVYYISLSPSNHTLSRLHLVFDGVQYTAYDDSLYYGERNFDTGEQIAQ